MEPESLPLEGCCPSLFESPWVAMLIDDFIEGSYKTPGEHINGLWAVDVILSTVHKFFKLGNVLIKVLSLHFDPLTQGHSVFFLL